MRRWYCFEVRGRYIGKCLTTADEIRAAMPHVLIEGNLVQVISP